MELILAILVAGPVGYFTETRKRGLAIYLALWAIVGLNRLASMLGPRKRDGTAVTEAGP